MKVLAVRTSGDCKEMILNLGCILSLSNYEALSKPFNLSEPPSPPLQNGFKDQPHGVGRSIQ